jgi:DNA-binding beta-propeller fold protein YncE
MRTFVALLCCCALLPLTTLTMAGPGHSADVDDSIVIEPLFRNEVRDLLGDPHQERAFLTAYLKDAVMVLDEHGRVVRTIDGLPDAWHLALDDAGETLFVTLRESREVAAVDLDTWEVTRHHLGGEPARALHYVSGLLWVVAGKELVSFDPETAETIAYPIGEGNGHFDDSVAHPAIPHTMFSSTRETLLKWRLTPGEAPTVVARGSFGLLSPTVSPDGRLFGTSEWHFGHVFELRSSDLKRVNQSQVRSRGEGGSVGGIAFAPDGTMSAAFFDSHHKVAVRTYAPGESVISTVRPLPGMEHMLQRGTAVYGGDHLYVIARQSHRSDWHVAVVDSPTGPDSHPVGTRSLQVPEIFDMLAAHRARRVFVSTGRTGNSIFVLDERGVVERVLERLPGPTGMVLRNGGRELWVMLSGSDELAVIDTRTLRVRRVPLPPGHSPRSLASQSGLLWFQVLPNNGVSSWMAHDPVSGATHGPLPPDYCCGQLFTSPLHPKLLYWLQSDLSWEGTLLTWQAEGGASPAVTLTGSRSVGAGARELDFTPDGLHVVVAAAGRSPHFVLDARTLQLAGDPETDRGPAAVAVRSDGLIAYGTAMHDLPGQHATPRTQRRIDVRRSTWGRSVARVDRLDRYYGDLVPRGAVFGHRHLFAVLGGPEDYLVKRVTMPPRYRITVTSDKPRYISGDRARVVAHIGRGSFARVHFTRVSPRGSRVKLGWRRVDKHGNASITLRLQRTTEVVGTVKRGKKRWGHVAVLPVDRPN